MKILRNTMPISDLYNLMRSGELTINRSYQRGAGLWPDNARSYFIDSVLNDFPFPKVVIRQIVDLKLKKTKREIIDGQQRLTTIRDFIEGKIKLSAVSKEFKGMRYDDLPEGIPDAFLAYEVSIDTIVSATTEEILEVFRRINSYTLPLNPPEKRHATFQGEFKWFVSDLLEYFTPFFEKYDILSIRDISRMLDADLITEFVQIKLIGITNRSAAKLDEIYRKNDEIFERKVELNGILIDSFNFVKDNLSEVFENFKVPSYTFYSLMGALIFNKYGLSDVDNSLIEMEPVGMFASDIEKSKNEILRIFSEADSKIENGKFPDFVKATLSTTHSQKHRLARIKTLAGALQLK